MFSDNVFFQTSYVFGCCMFSDVVCFWILYVFRRRVFLDHITRVFSDVACFQTSHDVFR